jgi:hypothetical protein
MTARVAHRLLVVGATEFAGADPKRILPGLLGIRQAELEDRCAAQRETTASWLAQRVHASGT